MSSVTDGVSRIKPLTATLPTTLTASANSASIDKQKFHSASAIVTIGTPAVAFTGSIKADFTLQESDDNSTWKDCADQDIIGADSSDGVFLSATSAEANDSHTKVGYIGLARYLRIKATLTGNHGAGFPYSALFIMGSPRDSADAQ